MLLPLLVATSAFGETSLNGSVRDAVTGALIVGATLEVLSAGSTIGSDHTNAAGGYEVVFTPPSSAGVSALALQTALDGYVTDTSTFQIRDGHPVDAVFDVNLLPIALAACRSQAERSVIIGHFRSPVGQDFQELPNRIADVLYNNLGPLIQGAHIPFDRQPSFEPCDEARPRTTRLGKVLARALGADAFLSGDIAADQSLFKVSTYVSDAYAIFAAPRQATSRSVDLNTAAEAKMSDETKAAVLASVAAGFADHDDCATALSVMSVAEAMPADAGSSARQFLAELRTTCEASVPNSGLLPGATQQ